MKVFFQRRASAVGALVAMAGFLCLPSVALAGPILGSAQSFSVLGGSAVTNIPTTNISGSVGVYPGSSIPSTGIVVTNGTLHLSADAVVGTAQNDERFAYNALAALPFTIDETGIDLSGKTLTPGVYKFTSGATLNGPLPLTLNFLGNPNALFVFQIATTLITGSATTVTVLNGGNSSGIFWQVGTSATLGSTTTFAGNILALTSITLNNQAKILCGRAFAQTGAVTMDANTISGDCGTEAFLSGRSDFGSGGFSPASTGVVVVTPEPGTFLLWGIGLIGLAKFSARKK